MLGTKRECQSLHFKTTEETIEKGRFNRKYTHLDRELWVFASDGAERESLDRDGLTGVGIERLKHNRKPTLPDLRAKMLLL